MRTIVAWLVLLLVATLALLVIFILVRRMILKPIDRWHAQYRHQLTKSLSAWLDVGAGPPPRELASPPLFLGRRILMEVVLERLVNATPREHQMLLEYLERIGQARRWRAALRSRRAWKRALAAEQLGIARIPDSIEQLKQLLSDPSIEVQIRAAQALARLRTPEAIDALVSALTRADQWSTARVSDLLLEAGTSVVPPLLGAFPHLPKVSQLAAIDVMARLKAGAAIGLLVNSLGHPDADIRARSAAALGATGARDACAKLIAALNDPQWPVRAMCAKALGQLKAAQAVSALCSAMRDREWWVRLNAAEALRSIGPAGIDALFGMLDDHDRFAREQAFAMLEHSQDLDRRLALLVTVDTAEYRRLSGAIQRLLASRNRVPLDVELASANDAGMAQPVSRSLRS